MTKKKETWLRIISGLIGAMFFYAALSKLVDYEQSNWEMRNQVFTDFVADVLTWLVPSIEILLVMGLNYRPTRIFGLWASLGLLTVFTVYIILVLGKVFDRVPCSCGGVIGQLSYDWHMVFNFAFITLAIIGLWIEENWKLKNLKIRIVKIWSYLKNSSSKTLKEKTGKLLQG